MMLSQFIFWHLLV